MQNNIYFELLIILSYWLLLIGYFDLECWLFRLFWLTHMDSARHCIRYILSDHTLEEQACLLFSSMVYICKEWSVAIRNEFELNEDSWSFWIFYGRMTMIRIWTYRHPKGTTILVASSLEDGHTLYENLIPSLCSGPWKSHCCILN